MQVNVVNKDGKGSEYIVDEVLFVNHSTYGMPKPEFDDSQKLLYINVNNVLCVEVND